MNAGNLYRNKYSIRSIRLIQKEYYSGLLIPFSKKQLTNNTKQGFELMNQAIKEKAESI